MNRQETIAAYALGELEGAERERFEGEVAADPTLRAEVEATRGTMAQLEALPGDAWPAAAPEPLPPEPASVRSAKPHRRFALLRPVPVAAMILVAAVLGGIVGALIASGGDSSPPAKTVLILHPIDAPKNSRADISMPKSDTMLLQAKGLPPSSEGDYYEVWLMSSDSKLVPVASFKVGESGEASVEVPLPAAPGEYTYFDVSRQSVSGGLDHSQDSVLRGPTSGLGA
ncbi:MAG: anti-sigma factor [Actinobacteria bacterium]|nr:anti-sigma factor [Actinomycetota bacterium]